MIAAATEQPAVSTVPLLAFNGVYDPIEQPRNWAGAQQLYPDSRDIALPGQGHQTNPTWVISAAPARVGAARGGSNVRYPRARQRLLPGRVW